MQWITDRAAHDRCYVISTEQAKEALRYEVGPPIEHRLAELVAWYRSQSDWWKPLIKNNPVILADIP